MMTDTNNSRTGYSSASGRLSTEFQDQDDPYERDHHRDDNRELRYRFLRFVRPT